MLAIFKFDDEDTYYPEQYNVDGPSKWIAEIMTSNELIGSFCLTGERVLLLKERGREDILEAIKKHELVSHQLGNQKPELLDILAKSEWEDGVKAIGEYEDLVTRIFEEVFQCTPQALSRHNRQWGAQHVAVAAQRSLPYQNPYIGIPNLEQPCWYAGAICLPLHLYDPTTNEDIALTPELRIGESYYACDDTFQRSFEHFKENIEIILQRGVEFIHVFGAHPSRIRARGFLENRLLANGIQRTIKNLGFLYETVSEASDEQAKENFRKLCQYIRYHPKIDCRSTSEVATAFSHQPNNITQEELADYAQEMVKVSKKSATNGEILLHQTFSPGELLLGMAESLILADERNDHLPLAVDRRNIMGPTEIPTIGLEISSLTHKELIELCRSLIIHSQEDGYLPANLFNERGRIGVGQLAVVIVHAYDAEVRFEQLSVFNPTAFIAHPEVAWNIDTKMRRIIYREQRLDPNLESDKIAKHARLQTWTLKPAWLNPPRGKSHIKIQNKP